jgi:hypothetical protein
LTRRNSGWWLTTAQSTNSEILRAASERLRWQHWRFGSPQIRALGNFNCRGPCSRQNAGRLTPAQLCISQKPHSSDREPQVLQAFAIVSEAVDSRGAQSQQTEPIDLSQFNFGSCCKSHLFSSVVPLTNAQANLIPPKQIGSGNKFRLLMFWLAQCLSAKCSHTE